MKEKDEEGGRTGRKSTRVSVEARAQCSLPHEIAVAMYDFLILRNVLALECVQRIEQSLSTGSSLGDHPAHSAGRERHPLQIWR